MPGTLKLDQQRQSQVSRLRLNWESSRLDPAVVRTYPWIRHGECRYISCFQLQFPHKGLLITYCRRSEWLLFGFEVHVQRLYTAVTARSAISVGSALKTALTSHSPPMFGFPTPQGDNAPWSVRSRRLDFHPLFLASTTCHCETDLRWRAGLPGQPLQAVPRLVVQTLKT